MHEARKRNQPTRCRRQHSTGLSALGSVGLSCWTILSTALCLASCGEGDAHRGGAEPTLPEATEDLEDVRAEIAFAWDTYAEHAWGADELRPLSRTGADWHDVSLGLTIVDSVDTLHLAGLDERRDRALDWIRTNLSFDHDIAVSTFETSIRHLGGLLAAYAFLGDPKLLELASDLGERLLPAFDSPTGMPFKRINLRTGEVSGEVSNVADIGTYLLEFAALTRWTGDDRYEAAARAALDALWERHDAETGLIGSELNVVGGTVTLPLAQVGGGVDSYVEYLLKGAILLNDAALRTRYEAVVSPLNEYLSEETPDGLFWGFGDPMTGDLLLPVYGALGCFFPGMLTLAGDFERGIRGGDGCWSGWTENGLMPEAFNYRDLTIVVGNHELRPEVAESFFYLWRATGDPVWRERGRTLLADLKRHCRTDAGYTVVRDVRTKEHGDGMPSFFLAETLKYLLLLFADDQLVPLEGWVFNTEAHPLPIGLPVP